MIDQHLAHQRILYERYEQSISNHIAIQRCLIPITFELAPADAVLLESILDELKLLGYDVEVFGSHTFIIQGAPADVKLGSEKESMGKIIEAYKHEQTEVKLDKREKLFRMMAMQRAISSTKKLATEEMEELFQQLLLCEQPQLSPNGKKIFAKLSVNNFMQLIQHA